MGYSTGQSILRYLLFLLAGYDYLSGLDGSTRYSLLGYGPSLNQWLLHSITNHLVADLTKAGNADLLPEGFDTTYLAG